MEASEMKMVKQFISLDSIKEWMQADKVNLMKKDYPSTEYNAFIDFDKMQIIVIRKAPVRNLTLQEILKYKIDNKHHSFVLINTKTDKVPLTTNHEYYLQKLLATRKAEGKEYKHYVLATIPKGLEKMLK